MNNIAGILFGNTSNYITTGIGMIQNQKLLKEQLKQSELLHNKST